MTLELNHFYNMDNMEGMAQIPDKFFDLAVADPPYGINAPNMNMGCHKAYGRDYESTAVKLKKGRLNSGGGKLKNRALNTMDCDWDLEPPSDEYFKELFRVSKNQIIFGANYFNLPPTRGIGCWDKIQPWDNFSQFELIWTSFDCPAFMIRISSRGGANEEKKIHPTQKPVSLYLDLFNRFTKPGYKILDPNAGSMSSLVACHKLKLDYIAFEINKGYFDSGGARLESEKRQISWFDNQSIHT